MVCKVKKWAPVIVMITMLACTTGGCGGKKSSISDTLSKISSPQSDKTFYQLRNQYVRIEPQDTCDGFTTQPNEHPAQLPEDRLRAALSSLMVLPPNLDDPIPIFSAREIDTLTDPIRKALGSASPGEDVLVATVGSHPGGMGYQRGMTIVRLFMAHGEMNVIFGSIHLRIDQYAPQKNAVPDDYRLYPFQQGTRCTPLDTDYQFMASESGVRFYAQNGRERRDWMTVDVGIVTERKTPRVSDRAVYRIQPATGEAPAPVASRSIEERLEILKRLRDKDLITEKEYNEKKIKLLEEI